MQLFNVQHFVLSIDSLEDIAHRCAAVIDRTGKVARDVPIPPDVADHARPTLQYIRQKCAECELTNAAKRIDQELLPLLSSQITFDNFFHQLAELKRDIRNDLEFRRFVYIATDKADFLIGSGQRWEKIWKAIPSSEQDTREATESYALGLHTAAVFHAMRTAECGLRYLARRMHVKVSDKGKVIPIEHGTWEKIIVACQNQIAAARKLPTNARRANRLQFFSRAADHCGYMKDIWRNEVSHARKSYIEPEARAALDRIHAFMEFLATSEGN